MLLHADKCQRKESQTQSSGGVGQVCDVWFLTLCIVLVRSWECLVIRGSKPHNLSKPAAGKSKLEKDIMRDTGHPSYKLDDTFLFILFPSIYHSHNQGLGVGVESRKEWKKLIKLSRSWESESNKLRPRSRSRKSEPKKLDRCIQSGDFDRKN